MKKIKILVIFAFVIFFFAGCQKYTVNETKEETADVFEKGYNLPIENDVREDVESDCKEAMEKVRDIYITADKGDASNITISEITLFQMLESVQKSGHPTVIGALRSDMSNYKRMEEFLNNSLEGKKGEVVLYNINLSGGISREQFIFDGRDMYILVIISKWNEENEPVITQTSYNRIKEWKYTEKGWFSYEYCVPESPEVTEVIDAEVLLRVKPLKKEYKLLSSLFRTVGENLAKIAYLIF